MLGVTNHFGPYGISKLGVYIVLVKLWTHTYVSHQLCPAPLCHPEEKRVSPTDNTLEMPFFPLDGSMADHNGNLQTSRGKKWVTQPSKKYMLITRGIATNI